MKTPLCELLQIEHPVILGGMATGTSAPLVAAVCNAGGLGTMGLGGMDAGQVRAVLAAIRAATQAPFGVNFLLFQIDEEALEAALAEKPPVIAFAWAWPEQDLARFFERAHSTGAKVMHMAADVPEARRAAAAGADVVVAQGSEGGGHVGWMGSMPLVPMVVDALAPLPVVAAGGIADGRGLAAALALGAQGVLLGTRFLATEESPLHPNFKQAIVRSDGHDTLLTEIPDIATGRVWPGAMARALRNRFIERWAGREWALRQNRAEVATALLAARKAGDVDYGTLLIGQDAGLIDAVLPAGEVVRSVVAQAERILGGGAWRP